MFIQVWRFSNTRLVNESVRGVDMPILKDTGNQIVTQSFETDSINVFPWGHSFRTTFRCKMPVKEERQTLLSSWAVSQRLTLSCLRTRSMKNFQQFSLISVNPDARTSDLTLPMMFSTSSSGNRSGISPWMSKTNDGNQSETHGA